MEVESALWLLPSTSNREENFCCKTWYLLMSDLEKYMNPQKSDSSCVITTKYQDSSSVDGFNFPQKRHTADLPNSSYYNEVITAHHRNIKICVSISNSTHHLVIFLDPQWSKLIIAAGKKVS